MTREVHWNHVYQMKHPNAVSWYQRSPEKSLAFVRKLTSASHKIIDVGGGASGFVDALLDAGTEEDREVHVTPGGSEQRSSWTVLRRR